MVSVWASITSLILSRLYTNNHPVNNKMNIIVQDTFTEWTELGEKWGWLKNPSLSTTLPRSGWQYGDTVTNIFLADDSINVNEGRLISDCTEIKVTLTGAALEKWPKGAGVFKLQHHRFFNGRHIYKNEENWLLHCDNKGAWGIGYKLNYYAIRSKSAPMVPSSSDEWFYFTGSEVKGAKVEIICRDIL